MRDKSTRDADVVARIGPETPAWLDSKAIPHALRRADRATAIILARGGSKGVPAKNARTIAGRPCIEWTIDAARAASRVRTVVVSTDDERIGAIARAAGAVVVERPAELATDTARVDDAARHAVERLEADRQRHPSDHVAVLYANVPVRPAGLIDRALALLADTGADSVQSYAPVGKHHPWWTARVDRQTGRVRPWEGDVLNHGTYRRQDLPPAYVPDAGVIALTRAALFCTLEDVPEGPHAFFGKDRRGIVTAEGDVVDIDTETDLLVADAVLRSRRERTSCAT